VRRAKLACGRVGDDGNGMVVQPNRPSLRLLSGPVACAGHQLVHLHGVETRSPHTSWWRRSRPRLAPRVVAHAPVGVGRSLGEAETCRARRRLVVRGGDLSEGVPLVGNWSEMLPTGQEHDVLLVRVLTEVLSPPRLESWPSRYQSWPSRCQSWPSHCQWR
jgi:hypothetical protein